MVLKKDLISKIVRESEFERALQYAYFLLSRRDYSQHDLALKLKRKNYDQEIIDEVIRLLKKNSYLDDARLLKRLCEYYWRERRSGRLYIIAKLMDKGFHREEVENEIKNIDEKNDEWEKGNCTFWAEKWLRKKGAQEVRELDFRQRQALYQYLINKGFSSHVVAQYLHE